MKTKEKSGGTLTVGLKDQLKAGGLIRGIGHKLNEEVVVSSLEVGRGSGTTETLPQWGR